MNVFYVLGFAVPLAALAIVLAWKNPLFFLGIHISTRAILDGSSQVTYQNIAFGISIMQIYSLCIILFLSVYLAFKKNEINDKLFPFIIPVALIVLSYILSGILNGNWMPVIENSIKWIYMLLFAGFIVYTLQFYKIKTVLLILLIATLPAILIQLHAIVMGNSFVAAGGHIGYRGGFHHHNNLSFFLLAFTTCCAYLMIYYKNLILKFFFMFSSLYGIYAIYLCGYRTTLVALMITLLITLIFYFKKGNIEKKALSIIIMPLLFILAYHYMSSDLIQRLSDIVVFVQNPYKYLDFSGHAINTGMMSGRIYIINTMMSSFLSGTFDIYIFGYGIGHAHQLVGTYSHNEFLSSLVETGILGFSFFIYFIARYIFKIYYNYKFANLEESVIVGTGIGLLIMSLATMPFRDMRAMILFGLVLGVMHFYSLRLNLESSKTDSIAKT